MIITFLGLTLLFFLPIIESFNVQLGLNILFVGSILISLPNIISGRFRLNSIGIIFLSLLIYFLGIIPFSWSVGRSYTEFLRYLSYFLVFITIINLKDKVSFLRNYFIPMVIVNSTVLILLYWLYSFPGLHLVPPTNGMNLFYPTFRHNRISDILIIAIPICLFLLSTVSIKTKKFLILIFLLIFLFQLFFSVGLGAILSLSFAFFMYSFLAKKLKDNRVLITASIILGFTASLIMFASFIYSQVSINNNQKSAFYKSLYKPPRTDFRLDFINQAFKGFQTSPFIGTGLDTFRYVSMKFQIKPLTWSWYVHNHYIELFSETGMIGGLLFVILILGILRKTYQVAKNSPNYILSLQNSYLFIILLALSLLSLMDYSWHYLSIFLIFWICAALMMPAIKEKTKSSENFLFITTLIILYSVYFLFSYDIDSIIKQADKYIASGKKDQAIQILTKAHVRDKKNYQIAKRLGQIYENNNNDNAHKWNEYAISLDPLDSEDIIRKDYDLFIQEIVGLLDKKDLKKALLLIEKTKTIYPFYIDISTINEYLKNFDIKSGAKTKDIIYSLKEYMKKERKAKNDRKLSIPEIQMIQIIENGG